MCPDHFKRKKKSVRIPISIRLRTFSMTDFQHRPSNQADLRMTISPRLKFGADGRTRLDFWAARFWVPTSAGTSHVLAVELGFEFMRASPIFAPRFSEPSRSLGEVKRRPKWNSVRVCPWAKSFRSFGWKRKKWLFFGYSDGGSLNFIELYDTGNICWTFEAQ